MLVTSYWGLKGLINNYIVNTPGWGHGFVELSLLKANVY